MEDLESGVHFGSKLRLTGLDPVGFSEWSDRITASSKYGSESNQNTWIQLRRPHIWHIIRADFADSDYCLNHGTYIRWWVTIPPNHCTVVQGWAKIRKMTLFFGLFYIIFGNFTSNVTQNNFFFCWHINLMPSGNYFFPKKAYFFALKMPIFD